jgi:signal transduction histidine kinase
MVSTGFLYALAGGDLGDGQLGARERFEDRYGATARIVLADDLPPLPGPVVEAVVGAVAEAMTNAAKHGDAKVVTVYAEPTDAGGLLCSVKDDGSGFDPATTTEGQGLTSSVRGRITEVGGAVEVHARPGRGAEVVLTVPAG